jgi:BRO family, N-terminal domain
MIKGEPWFVAGDVCEILGIENVSDALSRIKSVNIGSIDVENSATGIGAGKPIMGAKANTPAWYQKNKDKILLHPATREWVENSLITLAFKWRRTIKR